MILWQLLAAAFPCHRLKPWLHQIDGKPVQATMYHCVCLCRLRRLICHDPGPAPRPRTYKRAMNQPAQMQEAAFAGLSELLANAPAEVDLQPWAEGETQSALPASLAATHDPWQTRHIGYHL